MQADLAGLHFQATTFRLQRLIRDMKHPGGAIEHVSWLPLKGRFVLCDDDSCL